MYWKCSYWAIFSNIFRGDISEFSQPPPPPPPIKALAIQTRGSALSAHIVRRHRETIISYVRIGPQISAWLLIRHNSIMPMAYEEMLTYETLNVAYDYKWRLFLALNYIFGIKLVYNLKSAYGLQYP